MNLFDTIVSSISQLAKADPQSLALVVAIMAIVLSILFIWYMAKLGAKIISIASSVIGKKNADDAREDDTLKSMRDVTSDSFQFAREALAAMEATRRSIDANTEVLKKLSGQSEAQTKLIRDVSAALLEMRDEMTRRQVFRAVNTGDA